MQDYLILTIQAFITAAFVVAIVGSKIYQTLLEICKLKFKPFNCSLCTTFWVFAAMHLTDIYSVMFAGVAYFFADFIDKKLNTY